MKPFAPIVLPIIKLGASALRDRYTWNESDHPRGQPENKGEFVKKSEKQKPLKSLGDIRSTARNLLQSGKQVYIRWSVDPVKDQTKWGGKSKDSLSGQMHEGLSAVQFDPDWLEYSDEAFVRVLSEYSFLRMKNSRIKPWLTIGEQHENDYGDKLRDSDGYPLIAVKSAMPIDAKFLDTLRRKNAQS